MRELLEQALDALTRAKFELRGVTATQDIDEAVAALREALAAPMPEPVIGTKTWFEDGKLISQNLTASDVYAAPPAAPAPVVPDLAACVAWVMGDDATAMLGPKCCNQTVTQRCPGCPHAAPPAAPAVPLTDSELAKIAVEDEFLLYCDQDSFNEIARAVEQAHGIGGGGK